MEAGPAELKEAKSEELATARDLQKQNQDLRVGPNVRLLALLASF